MSNLFDSIFNNATATVDPVRLLLALLVRPLSRDGPILDLQIPNTLYTRVCH